VICLESLAQSNSEPKGSLSGSLDLNANVFLKDSSINAFNIPQYEKQFFGGESWLNLRYDYGSLSAGLRYDFFLNSNIPDPNNSFTQNGIGRWYVSKKFDKIDVNVGYLYDQIGSGTIYRAYESRPLFIDNALLGVSLKFKLFDNLTIKALGGQQKNAFDVYSGSIKGINVDYFLSKGEESPLTLAPGLGFVNKTLSDEIMDKVVRALSSYLPVDRFGPVFNSYAFTAYNTLTYKNISWYVEGSLKKDDIYFNNFAQKSEASGATTRGKFQNTSGSVLYTTIGYAGDVVGLTLEAKRTENFVFRTDPTQRLLRGYITYLPPMNRQNTYRLTARYSPFTQEISELAFQLDYKHRWSKKLNHNINLSWMNTKEGQKLYREIYADFNYKPNTAWNITGGFQHVQYNQEIYEEKPGVPIVNTYVPFTDILYKINRKNSIRFETQYMFTQQDFGSWIHSLAEYTIAPQWFFEASVMYNTVPKRTLIGATEPEKIAYPSFGVTHIAGQNRLQLRYVKQVEGIVCSGGICRLEPAFSGIRFSLNSQF
jgi:Family of unknown function (DUF6029)